MAEDGLQPEVLSPYQKRRYVNDNRFCLYELVGAGGGNRTHTGGKPHGILSPARLPVSPLRRGRIL